MVINHTIKREKYRSESSALLLLHKQTFVVGVAVFQLLFEHLCPDLLTTAPELFAVLLLLLLSPPPRRLCLHPHHFLCWFVSRITQKALNRFPPDLDGGWVLVQNRPELTFGADLDKGLSLSAFSFFFFFFCFSILMCFL